MAKLYVVGLGPGGRENMTLKAVDTIKSCKVVVGYTYYIELIEDLICEDQKIISTGMRGEVERCKLAIEHDKEGLDTCIISTGDAGLYGMAGPIFELAEDVEIEVIPGVSSCFSAASVLGAPIMHDFATISLSDLLTPWEVIEKRIDSASRADFVISIYNPRSKGRQEQILRAVEIMLEYKSSDTPVGLVKHSGRDGEESRITTLGNIDYEFIDMMTMVIIGNKKTYVKEGKMITPRGYDL